VNIKSMFVYRAILSYRVSLETGVVGLIHPNRRNLDFCS
jgi:hypothetical protein